ncbi:N-acetyl-gamma-glutamyl-phosphate reductase [Nakamurella sp. A5-74]|uniref:N-acetyl-gamma-glutamyl-phosphate reductase n=1 Tax=Nakamurella sp. A5-74 TaxID=3158264 RepID=A0AAU8DKQ3_9ACTN
MTARIAVAGATGYAGGELLRLLLAHPGVEIGALTAHSNAGSTLGEHQPHLWPLADRVLAATEVEVLLGHDVVFLALPHGQSHAIAAALESAAPDTIVIDCGADHRLVDPAQWTKFYGSDHAGTWPYGLPELPGHREALRGAKRVAVPGCYPTVGSLTIAPAIAAGLVTDQLTVVAASGTSGAGKAPKVGLLGSEVMGSASAYGLGGAHRHNPEFHQNLEPLAGHPLSISFTPVLVPMSRGILATVSAPLADPTLTAEQAHEVFSAFYADEKFVRVLPIGQFPVTAATLGANTCLIGVTVDAEAGRLVAVGAIDNLTKGTAGAAVQCLNLALGLEETLGLPMTGVAP